MATLMRHMGVVRTILQPTLTVTSINRSVRRRQPAACSEFQGINVSKPECEDVQAKGSDEHQRGGSPSVQDCTHSVSHQQTTNKKANAVLTSKKLFLNQINEGRCLQYEKARPDDKRLARLINLSRSKKLREQQGKIILEGRYLISTALEAGAVPQTIFFSTEERLRELPLDKVTRANLVKVKLEDVRIWPDLGAPVDMMAIFQRPVESQMKFNKLGRPLPLTLICDNVRDPGNLGATLRCAAAAGCHSVLLSTGCVDVWEPKVLRAAMCSHFHLPIIPNLTWSDIAAHLPVTATVHVADNCGGSVIKPDSTATPQQHKKAGDHGWVRGHHESKMHYEDDCDYVRRECRSSTSVLETQTYHSTWVGGHTAVVIGGETHGVSQEAIQLAKKTGGRRLLVPMVQGVDSLNSAMAASVLLFEGRRQLMLMTELEGPQANHVNS